MRLSDALAESRWIDIPFAGDNILRVKYRPSRATIADMQASLNGPLEQQMAQIIHQILDITEDWDLTQDDGETKVPLEFEALRHIPSNIFRTILIGIKEDQSSGEARSS